MSMSMEIENKKNKDEVSDDQLSLMREGIEAYEENDHECNDQCDHDKDPEIID